jgi:hypothetical protein
MLSHGDTRHHSTSLSIPHYLLSSHGDTKHPHRSRWIPSIRFSVERPAVLSHCDTRHLSTSLSIPHHLLSSQGDTRCPSPWQSDTQPPLTSCKVGMKLDLIRTDTSDTAICPISCIISHIFLNLRTGYGSFGY